MNFEDVFDDLGVLPKAPATIPDLVPDDTVKAWLELKQAAKIANDAEMTARKAMVAAYFPPKNEGSMTRKTPSGLSVSVTFTINRTIEKGTLTALTPQFEEAEISLDALVRNKPELVVSEYRLLSDEQRMLFDQAMTIKEGTPQVEIKVPKARTPAKRK